MIPRHSIHTDSPATETLSVTLGSRRMTSKRIAVPDDISLVCVPSDSWLQDLYPPVCHYANNPRTIARYVRQKVMELVQTGRVARKSLHVRLEFKSGATIGPPPGVAIRLEPVPQAIEVSQ